MTQVFNTIKRTLEEEFFLSPCCIYLYNYRSRYYHLEFFKFNIRNKLILKCSFKVITTEYIYIGRRPVGLEVFIGAIARLMDGQLNKATVVDIGMNFITDLSQSISLSHSRNNIQVVAQETMLLL